MLSRYRGKTKCPDCQGKRLRTEAGYVKIGSKNLMELVDLPIEEVLDFFQNLELDSHQEKVAKRLLKEIVNRLTFLNDVGLSYLTLNRNSNTLSGGESQRINLATSLGSSLVGSMYILDEPSIGLHPRDMARVVGITLPTVAPIPQWTSGIAMDGPAIPGSVATLATCSQAWSALRCSIIDSEV